ncbi:hypothetical protein [Sessilibacter corallicola]|uniref:hypothetical protein n=1 Tax=Sessilibacter corallicola TaxID=2904075 RepID=UPI00333FD8AE
MGGGVFHSEFPALANALSVCPHKAVLLDIAHDKFTAIGRNTTFLHGKGGGVVGVIVNVEIERVLGGKFKRHAISGDKVNALLAHVVYRTSHLDDHGRCMVRRCLGRGVVGR